MVKRFWIYVALTYSLAWAWWVPMAISGTHVKPAQGWPTHLPGLMAPSIAAVLVVAFGQSRAELVDLFKRCIRWQANIRAYALIALFVLLAFLPVMTGQATMAELGRYSGAPDAGAWAILIVLLLNGFGEEIGWRGFAAENLLKGHSISSTATKIAVVWGLWHTPLFFVVDNYRGFGIGGTIGWAVGIWFGSVFLVWLYQYTKHSVLVVVLWHVAYNFAVATDAAKGITPALVTMIVIAVVIAVMRIERNSSFA